jgi:putative chitinase
MSTASSERMITKAVLTKLWPKASAGKIAAIVRVAPSAFAERGIDDVLVVAHLMAQISHECGGGTIVRENMNYRAERIMEIFGVGKHSAKVTAAEAARLAHHPEELAERVYGLGNPKKAKELGNTDPGDGFRFRGGGDLQLTGEAAYEKFGAVAGIDLAADPDKIGNPEISFRVAVAEFVALGCVAPAKKDDVRTVTRRVNGGTNGLADRQVWLRRWKAALASPRDPAEPAPLPRGAELQDGKPIIQSKIAQASAAIGVEEGAQVFGIVSDAADKAKSIKSSAEDIGIWDVVVHAAQSPRLWIAVAVMVTVGLIIWWRWKDHS